MKDEAKFFQEISLLYELALAAGNSLDIHEACTSFLKILSVRKNITFASVWAFAHKLRKDSGDEMSLVYAYPEFKARETTMQVDHPLFQMLGKEDFYTVSHPDPTFSDLIQEKAIQKGTYAIFRLGDFGVLKIYNMHRSEPFEYREMAQLRNVFHKFSISLEACFAHMLLKREMDSRQQMEQILKESNEKYMEEESKFRNVVNTSLDAVIIIDRDGAITEWNKQAEHIFDYSKEEVLGKEMGAIIVPPQYRNSHRNGMANFFRTGEGPVLNNRLEISAVRRSGEEFPIELSITHIKVGDKDFFSAFVRDITDRKNAENDLLKAKNEAEQARIAEQQFLANMSHEIRTPMNAVIGMTHLLYETDLQDAQKELVDSIKFSGDSLLGIINDILDLSKIAAGEIALEEKAFNLESLVRNLQQSFQFKVKDKPISVVMDVDYRIDYQLIGDPTRLNQILTNLLGNASKFTHNGTIGVAVKMLEDRGNQYVLEFMIHDTGIGIKTDKIDLIFQNFKQADTQVTRKYGGTGLGLSIVKQLVELQEGTLRVESEFGKGSSFIFMLPFKKSTEKAKREALLPELRQESIDQMLANLEVLVVEDNEMNQRLIKKVLDIWNCPYDIANNGLEAVAKSKQKKYDIILMDIHMPEMDGCEAAKAIRADNANRNQNIPIIALTAAALLDEKKRVFESGMNDFLTKPFSPFVLKGMMFKWLQIDTNRLTNEEEKKTAEPKIKIDLGYLQEFSGGDIAFIQEMITLFLKEAPMAIQELKKALAEENYSQIYTIAHRFKPNLTMMGLKEQTEMTQKLEKMVKSEDWEGKRMKTIIDQLYVDIKEVSSALEQKLGELRVTDDN